MGKAIRSPAWAWFCMNGLGVFVVIILMSVVTVCVILRSFL
ncbi:hypothetical protein A11S_730 [Micavibrio aeruginosavorus EPB]|uniref:Uncharacterized protein n=1 Tax=Micavibrio aeruginosavorus EPB TaxID=349215 RepID=M4VWI7_9BACT|nr:hypothetical protein A11S_730 [Micavibrio aeruginosavorus EPB]